jgi:hypothetical protein
MSPTGARRSLGRRVVLTGELHGLQRALPPPASAAPVTFQAQALVATIDEGRDPPVSRAKPAF